MIQLKYPSFWSSSNWISSILIPFSYIYKFLGWVRKKITKEISFPGKVICVGNITVGGAGKTQLVIWLAKFLKQKNIPFVIITKAYKSDLVEATLVEAHHKAIEVGDESVILRNFGSVVAAKKVRDAVKIVQQLNPKIVILDDGLQNHAIKKDFNILAFDSLTSIGNNRIFPAGPLREGLSSGLAKADLIFMIGNQECGDFSLLSNIHLTGKPYFRSRIKLTKELDKNLSYIAFAGIGNPEKFYSLLKQNGLNVAKQVSFEDHHNYSENDLKKLIELAKSMNCFLITTEKDYVKLKGSYKELVTCARVELELEDEQKVMSLINEALL